MAKLTIAHKLGLVSLLFLLPVIYVVWTLVAQQNIAIDFGLKERDGTLYLRGLQAHGLSLARVTTLGSPSNGHTIAESVATLESTYGTGMESAELAQAAEKAFDDLASGAQPAKLEAARGALRALIARIGDKSNLILDPDLDSFYVMDLALVKLPDLVDRTAAMTTLARSDWSDGAIGTDEQVDFFVALGGLKSLLDGADGSVASGYSGNGDGSLKANLDPAYLGAKGMMKEFTDTVGKGTVDGRLAARTLSALELFYAKSSSELERLLDKRVDGFKGDQRTTLIIATILFLAAIGAVLAITLTSVIRPLSRLTRAMRGLASGDLNVEVAQADAQNEIGEMARALKVLRETSIRAKALEADKEAEQRRQIERSERTKAAIADFESEIGTVVSVVTTSSEQLQATAQSMLSTAERTTHQASAAANASSLTSGNVQTVAAATEELSASIEGIRTQAGDTARTVAEAAETANQAMARVHKLAESATKISEVIALINAIAAQTNLLALNATIEAARAGEAGKGFAVVAQEVKSLAGQTAKATEEIVAQVAAIQEDTRLSVQAIDGIVATIARVSELSNAIAAAVNEQGTATQEIARSVSMAASGTSEVSENIAAVTDAANTAGQASQQVLRAAQTLAKNSSGLTMQVEGFLKAVRA